MDYQKHHDLLISRARSRALDGYTENHHILPKCMGGDDSANNLVSLTPEEHYLIHQLLVKMYPGQKELVYAMHMMTVSSKRHNRLGNKMFGWIRRRVSEEKSRRMKGTKRPDLARKAKGHKRNLGKPRPDKARPLTISNVYYPSRNTAAKELGVNIWTINQWLKTGRNGTKSLTNGK